MNLQIKRTAFVVVTLLALSCNESPTTAKETTEIETMDSTTKVVKLQTEQLEEQTRKVEESIEKVDNEFKNE